MSDRRAHGPDLDHAGVTDAEIDAACEAVLDDVAHRRATIRHGASVDARLAPTERTPRPRLVTTDHAEGGAIIYGVDWHAPDPVTAPRRAPTRRARLRAGWRRTRAWLRAAIEPAAYRAEPVEPVDARVITWAIVITLGGAALLALIVIKLPSALVP